MVDPTPMIHFDWTVHLGDVITTILSGIVAIGGWFARRALKSLVAFIGRIDGYDDRIENTANVVDRHSVLLKKTNPLLLDEFPVVSQKRRREDNSVVLGL